MGSPHCGGGTRPADGDAVACRSRRNSGEDWTEQHWLYAAIDVETKLLLGVSLSLSERRGTDPAAEFLGRLSEKHDFSETTFLVDGMGYLTAHARCDLRGHLDYVERYLIEKWFQTLTMRINRFHQM